MFEANICGWLPKYGKQNTAQQSTNIKGNMSVVNDIDAKPEFIIPLNKLKSNWPNITEISHQEPTGSVSFLVRFEDQWWTSEDW